MLALGNWLGANRLLAELGGLLILALGFTLFVHHERDIGAQHETQKVEAAVARQAKIDAADLDAAHRDLAELKARFDSVIDHPPAPATRYVRVRVCDDPVPAAAHQDGGAGREGDAPNEPAGEVGGSGRDVTDVTRQILSDAGAVINYLQGYIRSCQDRGFCEKE